MVADAFDDGGRAAVAHGESLARHAAEERLAARGAVEGGVADDHRLVRKELGALGWPHDDAPPRQTLAHVVVRFAEELEREPVRGERAEALAGGAGEAKCDRVVGKTFLAEAPRHLAGQHGAHGAIHVPNRQLGADALFPVEREMRELEQRVVQSDGQPVILRAHHAP